MCIMTSVRGLSTVEVMRIARERLIQFSGQKIVSPSMISAGMPLSLSDEETKDLELAHLLLASIEKICNQQFDRASKFLQLCNSMSSDRGNSVERVVHYFANALQQRINWQTGGNTSKGMENEGNQPCPLERAAMSVDPAVIAWFQEIPFFQVTQFAGIQAILDNVASAKMVHLIDLEIDCGVQWTVLMEALATREEYPIELLKITAVATSKRDVEAIGERLACFAKTKSLPFLFKIAMVSDIKDLKEDIFELEDGEVVAIYSPMVLRSMVGQPDHLVSLISLFRNINPCVVVVAEIEANHNSPILMDRFIEALHFYSAYFDCFEACMDRNDPHRMTLESVYMNYDIQNIVAAEGKERITRHVKIDVWRTFFAQFGMTETELSMSSLLQASLVVKTFACESSCKLSMDGKCLIIGWKGTAMYSLSAWKFNSEGKTKGSEIWVPPEISPN